MKNVISGLVVLVIILILSQNVSALDRSGFEALQVLIDSAKVLQVEAFSPKTWQKAEESYRKASEAVQEDKNQKTINKHVELAREYVENAIKTTEVAKLSLAEYLEPRDKARAAKAQVLVGQLYYEAETQFIKAAKKVEEGDVKSALKEAEKSRSLFDVAEIEAVRVDIMGNADKLISKAAADEATKYAPSTLDKAHSARNKADAIITNDRYNRRDAIVEAARAEYEARHASNIAMAVRSLNRNDQAWEKLMLLYEIQMTRVGAAAEIDNMPYDEGPLAAADTLIAYIKQQQEINASLSENMGDLSGYVIDQLQKVLKGLNVGTEDSDPIKLVEAVKTAVASQQTEIARQEEQLATLQAELDELKAAHESTTAQLATRTEREEKFRMAKQALNPSEGEVLFNSSNDIVLRLGGLSFDVGKDQIKDEHIPLLEKVKGIIEMFPDATLMIEGHTDASGDASANVTLSEKRAYAVMQYLRQALLLPADQIKSMGYGADRPIGSNKTADGRAKNRRIDIIIMQ